MDYKHNIYSKLKIPTKLLLTAQIALATLWQTILKTSIRLLTEILFFIFLLIVFFYKNNTIAFSVVYKMLVLDPNN